MCQKFQQFNSKAIYQCVCVIFIRYIGEEEEEVKGNNGYKTTY